MKTSQDNKPVTEAELDNILPYVEAVFSGVKKGVLRTIDDVLHPIDNILYPMSQLVADATIIASGYTLDAIPDYPMVGGVNILQSVIKKDSPLFQDAAKRMRNRINGLEQSWSDFGSASSVARVEKLSELTTTLLAPGFVVKSAKSFINYNRFAQLSPPNFHALEKMSLVLKPVKSLTLQEIRGMKNTELMYVITQKGELIMTDQVYDHWHLARGKPVKGAGDVYIGEHGNIVAVDSRSGSFAPKSEKLGSLVEHVFEKNGFTEVKGRFEDWHKKIYSKPLPGTIIPIPKITHDGLWQPLTGVAFLKELYKPNGIFSNHEKIPFRNTAERAWHSSFSFISTAEASPLEIKTKALHPPTKDSKMFKDKDSLLDDGSIPVAASLTSSAMKITVSYCDACNLSRKCDIYP